MGIRFRRRIRIVPGLHLNLSLSGASVSVGPRGVSLTASKQGIHGNVGLPGTGLYAREKIVGTSGRGGGRIQQAPASGTATAEIKAQIGDDGQVEIVDQDGRLVAESYARKIRSQQGDTIRDLMHQYAAKRNAILEKVTEIHLETPPIERALQIAVTPFPHSPPIKPVPAKINWFARLIFRREWHRLQENENRRYAVYRMGMLAWEKLKEKHEAIETKREELLKAGLLNDDNQTMEGWLAERLAGLKWPRETMVSFEIDAKSSTVRMDVDLPEIEDMPEQVCNVPLRGWRVSTKELSDKQKRLNYARHVHGVAFRLIGEAFASLPTIQTVSLAGYSQRPSRMTGQIEDEYLLSARVSREAWSAITFENLQAVDPIEAFDRFETRRKMTQTGIFKRVEPFA